MTSAPVGLRLLSYNIRSMRDDRSALAAVIRGCAPDVVCVQEAPRFLGGRRRIRELAAATGLRVVTGGRSAAAMLLLARPELAVLDRRDVLLSKAARLHQRGLAVGVLRTPVGDLTVASMHLDLDAAERCRHVEEVFDRLAGRPAPLVLAGDVNEEPGQPAWARLTTRLQDAYQVAPDGPGDTYSSTRPSKRIDGIFVDHRLQVRSCGVPDPAGIDRASDHRPVRAVLDRPAAPPASA